MEFPLVLLALACGFRLWEGVFGSRLLSQSTVMFAKCLLLFFSAPLLRDLSMDDFVILFMRNKPMKK